MQAKLERIFISFKTPMTSRKKDSIASQTSKINPLNPNSEKRTKLFVRRQSYIFMLFAAVSFAFFSFFLFFALIDMIMTYLLPITVTASSALSELAIGLILLASGLYGLFGWKLAFFPTLLGWGAFYAEYLSPARLSFWSSYPFSSTSVYDRFFFYPTPFWLRPDADALGLFLIGFCFFSFWQIYSNRSRLGWMISKIFLVPAVMLVIFEVVIGTINPRNLESFVIEGFRIEFVPAFFWNIKNIWLLDFSGFIAALCLLELLIFHRSPQKPKVFRERI